MNAKKTSKRNARSEPQPSMLKAQSSALNAPHSTLNAASFEDQHRSQQYFRALFNWTPSAVGISTVAEGRLCDVNEGFSRLTGYTKEELIGRTTLELGLWADPSQREIVLREIREQGFVHNQEGLLRTKSGEIRSLMVTVDSIQLGSTPCLIYLAHDITERKRTEEHLRQRDELITLMLNTGPGCIKRVAEDGTLLSMNPAGLGLIDADNEREVVGLCVFDLVVPEHRDAFIAMHRAVLAGQSQTLEFEILGLRGTKRWMQTYAGPLRNPITGCMEQLAVTHDVTERKQMEKILGESEERFRSLVGVITDVPWTTDPKGQFVTPQEAYSRYTGASWEELRGYGWAQCIHPDDREQVVRVWKHSVATRTKYEVCCREWHGPTQQWRHVIARGTPVFNPDGSVREWVGSLTDVHEQYEAEAALRRSEERYRVATRATRDVIWDWDMVKDEVVWSEALHTVFGYPTEHAGAVIRDSFEWWTERIHPEDRKRVGQSFERAADLGSEQWYEEYRFLRANGTYAEIEDAACIVSNAENKPIRITGAMSDITERKQAEALLAAEKKVLELIATGAELPEVLDVLMRETEAQSTDGMLCSILLIDDSGQKLLHGAAPSFPPAYNAAIHGIVIGPSAGSCGTAAFERKPVFVSDIAGDPLWNDFKHLATTHGLSACHSTPILSSQGRLLGTIAMYYRRQHNPSAHDRHLIERATQLAGIAIERKQAEEALRESEERQRLALSAGKSGSWQLDLATMELQSSKQCKGHFGRDPEAPFTFEMFRASIYPEDRPTVEQRIAEAISQCGDYEADYRCIWPDGSIHWINSIGRAIGENGKAARLAGMTRDITKRKRTEEALRLAKFSMDRAADAVYWIDPQAKVLDVNEAAVRMLGYSKDELCAMSVYDLNPDFQADMWPGFWAETRESGPMVFESFHKAKNGRLIPIEVSVNFLSYDGKEYHCAFVRDITERKRAEAALIHSHNLLQSVIQTSPIRVFWKDRESRYLGCNQIFAKDAGKPTPEHVIGMMDYDLAWKEQAELYRADDRLVMESGLPKLDFEEPQTTPEGKRIWLRTSKVPLRDEMNQVIGVLGTYEDITERKRTEAALRDSEDRYRSIFERAVEGIFQTTPDGTYVAVNPALARIYGYDSPDDLIATVTDIAGQLYVDPGHRDEFLRLMQAKEEVTGFESLVYRKDGSFMWISESARTLRDQGGTIIGYEGTVEDITERKRAEGRLRVTLEQVRALSGRLATVQEEERTRIARELHDELGVKLTCLKIDLARARSLVGNGVRPALRAKLNDRVGSVIEQVDSTIAAVQRLVTQLRPALLDNLGLVAAIEWQSQDFQKRTGIPCTCVTNADEIALQPERATVALRICQEALTNTAKHAQATAVMITLTSQQDLLQMTVADNGVGISDTKASNRRSFGLLGMRERAAQCGGTVTIESDPDKGTTVTLCLPVGEGDRRSPIERLRAVSLPNGEA